MEKDCAFQQKTLSARRRKRVSFLVFYQLLDLVIPQLGFHGIEERLGQLHRDLPFQSWVKAGQNRADDGQNWAESGIKRAGTDHTKGEKRAGTPPIFSLLQRKDGHSHEQAEQQAGHVPAEAAPGRHVDAAGKLSDLILVLQRDSACQISVAGLDLF